MKIPSCLANTNTEKANRVEHLSYMVTHLDSNMDFYTVRILDNNEWITILKKATKLIHKRLTMHQIDDIKGLFGIYLFC